MSNTLRAPVRPRGLVGPSIAASLALVLLVGLGVWQLQRLDWKLGLIATIRDRTVAAPVPIPSEADWSALRPPDYQYRHVTVTGVFDHALETHVFRPLAQEDARGRYSGVGDLVLTPLRLASGAIVIVNRGFVPDDRIDPATRTEGQTGGTVTVTGLMREPEARNPFTPADNAPANIWYTRDPEAIAQAHGLTRVAPFTIDADAGPIAGDLPQAGETVLSVPNNHLSYAMTWFGLALGLAGVYAAYAWKRLHPPATADTPSDAAASEKTV